MTKLLQIIQNRLQIAEITFIKITHLRVKQRPINTAVLVYGTCGVQKHKIDSLLDSSFTSGQAIRSQRG